MSEKDIKFDKNMKAKIEAHISKAISNHLEKEEKGKYIASYINELRIETGVSEEQLSELMGNLWDMPLLAIKMARKDALGGAWAPPSEEELKTQQKERLKRLKKHKYGMD